MDKKKRPLNPDAARILEQYRNAGKTPAASSNGTAAGPDGVGQPATPAKPAAPPAAPMRRSGTRGK